ncbi:hypothetical protein MKX01_020017 [Papaver californicum]|nr:hypothetical protein MKX01_020017 [Papaver californicum]
MQKNNPDVEDVDLQDDKLFTSGFNRISSQKNNEENSIMGTYNPNTKRSISNREGPSSIEHKIPPTILEECKDSMSVISSTTGRCHKDSVNPLLFENYKNEMIEKRKQFIDEFLCLCSVCKVKGETLVIETNDVATAVIGLIPILNINKLVIGTTKSTEESQGIADRILKATLLDNCDIKIISRGKELIDIEDPVDIFKDNSPFSPSQMGSTSSTSSNRTIMDKASLLSRIFCSRSSSSNDNSDGNIAGSGDLHWSPIRPYIIITLLSTDVNLC